MTIGIAATGPRAGQAILRGLQVAEQVGQGAIRGFVSYAAFASEGQCLRYCTQDGGSSTLSATGRSNAPPCNTTLGARRAALMSSSPHRPEPLAQFVRAGANGCLVTGHRQPNARRGDRLPINERVLARLEAGESAEDAVCAELAADPLADAGIIALDDRGRLFAGNTARVSGRHDLGQAVLHGSDGNAVAVLHNAIVPVRGLAELVAQATLDVMEGHWSSEGHIEVTAGTPIRLGPEEAVFLAADDLRVECIQTADEAMLQAHFHGAAVYFGAAIYRGQQHIGYVLDEPYVVAEHGRVVSLDGRPQVRLGFRAESLSPRGEFSACSYPFSCATTGSSHS